MEDIFNDRGNSLDAIWVRVALVEKALIACYLSSSFGFPCFRVLTPIRMHDNKTLLKPEQIRRPAVTIHATVLHDDLIGNVLRKRCQ